MTISASLESALVAAVEGKTSALGKNEAAELLEAPPENTLKGVRDRAILATYLFHGLRVSELSSLTLGAIKNREGVPHLQTSQQPSSTTAEK